MRPERLDVYQISPHDLMHVNQGICPVQMRRNGITIVETFDKLSSAIPNLRCGPVIAAIMKLYALAVPLAVL